MKCISVYISKLYPRVKTCDDFVSSTSQTSQPKLEVFQELLSKYPSVFHPSRTPKSLLVHWQLLKQYYLLEDQSGGSSPQYWTSITWSSVSVRIWFLLQFHC